MVLTLALAVAEPSGWRSMIKAFKTYAMESVDFNPLIACMTDAEDLGYAEPDQNLENQWNGNVLAMPGWSVGCMTCRG